PVTSDDVPEGEAVKWNPSTGTTVDAGAKVTVRFSSGPGELEVPDVSGMSQDQARQTLEGQGFDPGGFSVETTDQAGFDKGEVVGTDPEAGTKAAPDDPITIILATGNVELPDLVGMEEEKAKGVVDDLGLTAEYTTQEDEGKAGVVLKQQPGPGTVSGDTRVDIVVCTEPEDSETASGEPSDTTTASPAESLSDSPSVAPSESPSDEPSESPSDGDNGGGGNGGQDGNGGGDNGGNGGGDNGGGGNGGTTGTNGGGQADSEDGPLGSLLGGLPD